MLSIVKNKKKHFLTNNSNIIIKYYYKSLYLKNDKNNVEKLIKINFFNYREKKNFFLIKKNNFIFIDNNKI